MTCADNEKYYIIKSSDLVVYGYKVDPTSSLGYSLISSFAGGERVINAIAYVSAEKDPCVYLLTGHDEIGTEYISVLELYLHNEYMDIKPLTLMDGSELKPGDTIIISYPRIDLTDEEYQMISDFTADGGRLMITLSPDLTNFTALIEEYGLSFGKGYVVEDEKASSNWVGNTSFVIACADAEHDITRDIADRGGSIIVYYGQPINKCEDQPTDIEYNVLLTSSAGSYVKPFDSSTEFSDPTDAIMTGSQILACTALKQNNGLDAVSDTRIALISTPYLYIDSSLISSSYDIDFTVNVIRWLAGTGDIMWFE